MLTQFLTRTLLHKQAHEYPLARKELEAAYKSMLGLTPEMLYRFSDAQLIEMFGNDEDIKATKSYVLGSLMKEEGAILRHEGDTDGSDRMFLRSLNLLLMSFNSAENEAESGHLEKINQLLVDLHGVEFPVPVDEQLLRFYELTGKYDKAENVLFELVEANPSWVTHGQKFYDRLLKHSDDELTAGGLSRSEVAEGMENLKQRLN